MKAKDHLIALLTLIKTADWYERKLEETLQPFGISHRQFNVLKILQASNPRPMKLKQIQAKLLNQTANTTRLVEKLSQKGLLKKEASPTSGRELSIGITAEGLALLTETAPTFMSLDRKMKKKFTEEEAKRLAKLLNKVRA